MSRIPLTLLILIPSINFTQAIKVFNASSVADIIEKKSASYKSFKGRFIYKRNKKAFYGTIIYQAPDLLSMQFGSDSNPQDKKIVSDQHYIWVKEGDIIARQKLGEKTNPIGAWNLRRMRKQYIPTAPNSGLEIMYGKLPAYQIILEPKWNTTSFREIEIISDRNGLIRRITGISRIGVKTELSLSYLEFNKEYDMKNFQVYTTEESQIYDNIFD